MKCINCNRDGQAGRSYRFYFGRHGSTDFPDRRTTRTHFSMGGSEDAYLCDLCVDQKIERRARVTAAGVFLLTVSLAVIRLLLDDYMPAGAALERVIGFPMALIMPLVIYFGIRRWKQGKQREEEGERLAIHARKLPLRALGYDAFFTQNEYSRLI